MSVGADAVTREEGRGRREIPRGPRPWGPRTSATRPGRPVRHSGGWRRSGRRPSRSPRCAHSWPIGCPSSRSPPPFSRSPRPAARPKTSRPRSRPAWRDSGSRVGLFPSWETLPHERLSAPQRHRRPAPGRAAPPGPPGSGRPPYGPFARRRRPGPGGAAADRRGSGRPGPGRPGAGDERSLEQVVEDLVAAAYTRTDLVERRGEFAVRGGILDVFPPTEEHPLRVEFWGDTVEEIRWFKVADQRSLEVAEHGLWAPPCRELLLTDEVRERPQPALADRPARRRRPARQARRGHRRRGHGVARAGPRRRHGDAARRAAPRVAASSSVTRSGCAPAPTTSSRPARSSSRRAGPTPRAGNAVPIDLRSVLGRGVVPPWPSCGRRRGGSACRGGPHPVRRR
jgi:hypothetical protein